MLEVYPYSRIAYGGSAPGSSPLRLRPTQILALSLSHCQRFRSLLVAFSTAPWESEWAYQAVLPATHSYQVPLCLVHYSPTCRVHSEPGFVRSLNQVEVWALP